jgi:hypothetical protein
MKLSWLFTLTLLIGGSSAAIDINNFSNNLATDLGPLLALFGDSMIKQFLSESTSYLTYINVSLQSRRLGSSRLSSLLYIYAARQLFVLSLDDLKRVKGSSKPSSAHPRAVMSASCLLEVVFSAY